LDVSGSAIVSATAVDLVGGSRTSGSATINPSPTTVTSVTNPYASLASPSFSTICDYTNYKLNGGAATLNPGTYCGGIATSNGAITMNPGTYILYGGGLASSGSGSFTGSGVFIYATCKPSPCSGSQSGDMNLSGSSASTLSAATSGTYAGVIYFQDPTAKNNGSSSVSGGSSTCFTGVIYVPESKITYSGGSSGGGCNTSLVANTIDFSGSANLGSNTTSGSGPSAPTAFLIE
jgi:hypothetical protein